MKTFLLTNEVYFRINVCSNFDRVIRLLLVMLADSQHLTPGNKHYLLESAGALAKGLPKHLPPHWTEQFESIFIGFGGLLAGFGGLLAGFAGLKIGLDWLNQSKLKRKSLRYKKEYPLELLNKKNGYRIVKISTRNEWWLLDETTGKRRWLKNMATVRDLDFRPVKPRDITKVKLEKYPQGEAINTQKL